MVKCTFAHTDIQLFRIFPLKFSFRTRSLLTFKIQISLTVFIKRNRSTIVQPPIFTTTEMSIIPSKPS